MNLNFRNRIATYYLVATALITALIFITIYLIVHKTVYNHLKEDLYTELAELKHSIFIEKNNQIGFSNPFEWNEGEHNQIEVNPTFIQVSAISGNILKKTPNLRNDSLTFQPLILNENITSTFLSNSPIYQIQHPIKNESNMVVAFILIAVPSQESELVLENLLKSLLISYPIILVILFFITRYIAGKIIAPVNNVIKTANRITKENLNERITLPQYQDEIHLLTTTINGLLDRLEDNLIKEKQFTADASHELRTPLSVIKGTLEVLIRKPREINQYVEKINYCITETDRMTKLIDQLLFLARFDSDKLSSNITEVDTQKIFEKVIERIKQSLMEKEIKIKLDFVGSTCARADAGMLEIVIENILSNSIKYSENNKSIYIEIKPDLEKLICIIKDEGFGMTEDQVKKVFDRFYRSDYSRNSEVEGFGLGLSIVKKLCEMQNITFVINSKLRVGTTFILSFPK